eukprot:TRINITY_DN1220_c0_g1_i1.p1 TRINITY_DN1220_c0_g1~~TRINITY_DN1220_c0_g1_i1.p1  ORF type:complete len:231 (-),score=99.43 TRINITY_DN1220_c0_g1_i1:70-732(-)
MSEPTKPWEDSQLDGASKKDLVDFLQKNGNNDFLTKWKLKGSPANVTKNSKKDQLENAYKDLFQTKQFRTEQDDAQLQELQKKKEEEEQQKKLAEQTKEAEKEKAPTGPTVKTFTKNTTKKGDKVNFPKKGDSVTVRYQGKLENGKVFDSNTAKKDPPLKFKVGVGQVIQGWDDALLEMSVGEKAEIFIKAEYAYGKKGIEGKIPPNSNLIFDVELVRID